MLALSNTFHRQKQTTFPSLPSISFPPLLPSKVAINIGPSVLSSRYKQLLPLCFRQGAIYRSSPLRREPALLLWSAAAFPWERPGILHSLSTPAQWQMEKPGPPRLHIIQYTPSSSTTTTPSSLLLHPTPVSVDLTLITPFHSFSVVFFFSCVFVW